MQQGYLKCTLQIHVLLFPSNNSQARPKKIELRKEMYLDGFHICICESFILYSCLYFLWHLSGFNSIHWGWALRKANKTLVYYPTTQEHSLSAIRLEEHKVFPTCFIHKVSHQDIWKISLESKTVFLMFIHNKRQIHPLWGIVPKCSWSVKELSVSEFSTPQEWVCECEETSVLS